MKRNSFLCLLFVFFLFAANPAFAKSPVWKIAKDGQHLFVGGTVHLLSQSDYPLPSSFDIAYKNSDILVLETDLQKFSAPEFQQKLLRKTMYGDDRNVTDFLKPETVQKLKGHLASRGIPLQNLQKFKVGMLAMTLTVVEFQRLGLTGQGVDAFFNLRALNEKKKVGYLETVDDQLDFISRMGEGSENEFLEYTLDDLEKLSPTLDSIKKAWRNGDIAGLEEIALDSWEKRFPEVYEMLVLDRNNDWVPKIEQMLKTEEVELVLFGAVHLVGDDGILAQLKKHGYKIENL
jgi:uncharacterized protein YbaP (TraB family)